MKTLTLKSMARCGAMQTTASRGSLFAAGRSLAFAEAILAKYSGMAGMEPSGAMMVFLTSHKDEAEDDRRRREHIELALKLVFVKYLTSRTEFHPITVNNTFADYLQNASLLINAPTRIESPRAFASAQTLAGNLQAARDPEEASGALAVYLQSETNVISRAQLVNTVENILRGQSAAAQLPARTESAAVRRIESGEYAQPSAVNLLAERETIRRFAELVHREISAPPSAAESHEVQVHELREHTAEQIHHRETHTEAHTETAVERAETREVHALREQLKTEQALREQQTAEQIHHRETHTEAHTDAASERAETREIHEHTAEQIHHRDTHTEAHTDAASERIETREMREHTAEQIHHRDNHTEAHTDAASERVETREMREHTAEQIHHRDTHTEAHTEAVSERVETREMREQLEREHLHTTEHIARTETHRITNAGAADSEPKMTRTDAPRQELPALILHSVTSGGFRYMMQTFTRAEHRRFHTEALLARVYHTIGARIAEKSQTTLIRTLNLMSGNTVRTESERMLIGQAAAAVLLRRITAGEDADALLTSMTPRERAETLLVVHRMLTARDADTGTAAAPIPAETVRSERLERMLLQTVAQDITLKALYTAAGQADSDSLISRISDVVFRRTENTSTRHFTETIPALRLMRTERTAGAPPVIHTIRPVRSFAVLASGRAYGPMGRYPALTTADNLPAYPSGQILQQTLLRVSQLHPMQTAGAVVYGERYDGILPDVVLRYYTAASDGEDGQITLTTLRGAQLETLITERTLSGVTQLTERILRESVTRTMMQAASAAMPVQMPDVSVPAANPAAQQMLSAAEQVSLQTILRETRHLQTQTEHISESAHTTAETRVRELLRERAVRELRTLFSQKTRIADRSAPMLPASAASAAALTPSAAVSRPELRIAPTNPMALLLRTSRTIRDFTEAVRTEFLHMGSVHTDTVRDHTMRQENRTHTDMLRTELLYPEAPGRADARMQVRMRLNPLTLITNRYISRDGAAAPLRAQERMTILPGRHIFLSRDAKPAEHAAHTDAVNHTDIVNRTDVMHRTDITHRAEFSELRTLGQQTDGQTQEQPSAYTHDAPMSLRREAAPAASAEQTPDTAVSKEELISRFGNLIDDPTKSAPSDIAAVSVYGADPRDDTKKLVREQAEQLAVQKTQIEELTRKQALLEDGLLKYSDTRRLCDEVMQRLKSQIRLEKSRYMG